MSVETYESTYADVGDDAEFIPVIAKQVIEYLRLHAGVTVSVMEDSGHTYDAVLWPGNDSVYFRVKATNKSAGGGRTRVSYGHLVDGAFVEDGYQLNYHTTSSNTRGYAIIVNGGVAWQMGIPGYSSAAGQPNYYNFALISCIRITPQFSSDTLSAIRIESPSTTYPYPRISFRGDNDTYSHVVRVQGTYFRVKMWELPESQYNTPDDTMLVYPMPLFSTAQVSWGTPTIGGSPTYYMSGRTTHGIGAMTEFKVGESQFVSLGRCCIRNT